MYWNEAKECMKRDELEQLQLERLQATLFRVATHVPFYRQKFKELKIDPDGFRSLDELRSLPFTVKQDLRDNYPYGLFAVPLRDVVRVHSSSGTTGQATVVGYTGNDIKTWSSLTARVLTAAGVGKDDVVQIAFGYGLFTGGFGLHYGAELVGASVIPISSGNTRRQLRIMQDFRTTALICTPSYALLLADTIEELGLPLNAFSLKYGMFGAEPWSEAMRAEIESRLKIKAIDIYGLSEIIGPGVAAECREEQRGLHIMEDHFLPEIVHRDTFEPLPVGEEGELVFTTLTKEAFPVIRYRTKDISRLIPDVCTCGRSFHRMPKVTGRTDDMMIIRGVNVFPSQIEEVIMAIEGVEPHYQIIVTRQGSLDNIEVQVEVSEAIFSDRVKELENLQKKLQGNIKDLLGISCKVSLVEPKSIQRSEGKAQRVIDQRKI